MKSIIKFAAVVALTSVTLPAFAYFGGSNLSSVTISGYPSFNEWAPSAPYSDDEYAAQEYRRKVEDYVQKANEYIENGNHDVEEIKRKQREARDEAERVIRSYNSWVRMYR